MNILLSAFAFSPIWGSEPGVGWNWAMTLARTHRVTVLTHAYFRAHVEPAAERFAGLPLNIVYVDLEPLVGRFHEQLLNSQLYYLRWQWRLRQKARALCRAEHFDLVHHITWGTFRYPSFLGGLGPPFVFGPVGGGERAPARFYDGLPWTQRLKEIARDMVIASSRIDPVLRASLATCDLILCKTQQTLDTLSPRSRMCAIVAQEIGAPQPSAPPSRDRAPGDPLQLLFAGRLLGWKGVHLAVRALAAAARRGIDARLTIVGSGPLRPFLGKLCERQGVARNVRFVEQVPREEMLRMYHAADVFLFPSLHDSSGNVVLEAMSRGLPVICLDLGGPPTFVTPAEAGAVVATHGLGVDAVVSAIADEIVRYAALSTEQSRHERLGALRTAERLNWSDQIARAYDRILPVVASSPLPAAAVPTSEQQAAESLDA